MEEPQRIDALPGTDPRAAQLRRELELMKEYLLLMFHKEDWHGVMDASADIREIVARLSMLAPLRRR